jgi:hypothetical protein
MDFNLENYDLPQLLALFDIKNLNMEELKQARKKVLMLHPDKNPTKDTTEYFEFFMRAFKKIQTIYSYIHHETDEEKFHQRPDVDPAFKKFVDMKKMDKETFIQHFNEMFEKVYIREEDGYAEWLKSDEAIYDKNDLESSRKKAMALTVEKELETADRLQIYSDVKDAHTNSVIALDHEKLYREKPKFKTVEEYQRYRVATQGEALSEKESRSQLQKQHVKESHEAIALSFSLLQREEEIKRKQKDYYSKYLMIQ